LSQTPKHCQFSATQTGSCLIGYKHSQPIAARITPKKCWCEFDVVYMTLTCVVNIGNSIVITSPVAGDMILMLSSYIPKKQTIIAKETSILVYYG